jgi:predicted Fe-S protein YdhL (DUF1289 family)
MIEATGLCEGCWRTIAEIAAWAGADDVAKRRIWITLSERRRAAKANRNCS